MRKWPSARQPRQRQPSDRGENDSECPFTPLQELRSRGNGTGIPVLVQRGYRRPVGEVEACPAVHRHPSQLDRMPRECGCGGGGGSVSGGGGL